jgi:hypothetical protein
MSQESMFGPVVALVLWTFAIGFLTITRRVQASLAGKVGPGDFRYGESTRVPPEAALPSRNFMNLMELPMLFYVLALALFVTHRVDANYLGLAWLYVAVRCAHSLVHVTYNNVLHRMWVYLASVAVLLVMWGRFGMSLL